MDIILHNKIKDKLRKFLNREPSPAEIINGQSDTNIMNWIRDDDAKAQDIIIKAQKVEIDNLKIKVK